MIGQERRQTPRTTLEKLTYIKIEPDNGGIVLNVSEGGLCFHSIAPVQSDTTVRFLLAERNRRVEADAELAWTDATGKTAGLRFSNVPPQARQEIQDWVIESPTASSNDDEAPEPRLAAGTFPVFSDSRPHSDGSSAAVAPALARMFSPRLRVRIQLSGFARGLATGLLIAALVAAVSWFHSYRHQVGEALIRWGERLAPKPQATQALQPAAPVPQPVAPVTRKVARKVARTSGPQDSLPQGDELMLLPEVKHTAPHQPELRSKSPAGAATTENSIPKAPAVAEAARTPNPAATSSLPVSRAVLPNLSSDKASPVHTAEPAPSPVRVEESIADDAGAISQMYFEVGKFKNDQGARQTIDKLTQLGFHATVIRKGHLWLSSNRVLVGPYGHDEQAEAAYAKLRAEGFQPRAFERGSRNVTLRSQLVLGKTRMPVGDYVVSWESYVNDAKVKFVQDNSIVATVQGKWVKAPVRYQHGAIVYRKNDDGTRTLLQIQFAGRGEAIVFSKPS